MKDIEKEINVMKFIFRGIAFIVLIVGLFFSYLIAEFDDAPGFILIGTTMALVGSSFVYGLGEIVIHLKLIYNELRNKNSLVR